MAQPDSGYGMRARTRQTIVGRRATSFTPMNERRDALLAAAQLTLAVHEVVTNEPGRQVGTVGRLEVVPNSPNVIPGVVRLTIDLRDPSSDKLRRLADAVRERARQIAARSQTTIELTPTYVAAPAVAAAEIKAAIERAAAMLALKTMRLPSGAGHDAQMMALLGPMGMIFVPNVAASAIPPGTHSMGGLRQWCRCPPTHRTGCGSMNPSRPLSLSCGRYTFFHL